MVRRSAQGCSFHRHSFACFHSICTMATVRSCTALPAGPVSPTRQSSSSPSISPQFSRSPAYGYVPTPPPQPPPQPGAAAVAAGARRARRAAVATAAAAARLRAIGTAGPHR